VICRHIATFFVAGLPPASSFYVPSLPELPQDEAHPLHMFAGHIPSDPNPSESDSEVTPHLFFFMVKNRRLADRERVMFWFNVSLPCVFGILVLSINVRLNQGGPGCSSFDGLMMENGPWRVDGRTGLRIVEGGWEEYTTMVYGVFLTCQDVSGHV
jgi:carboxypeptidase D